MQRHMSFSQLGLADALVQGILATGYTAPTEIQAKAIPLAVQGNDIIGLANTGTGKTAAFVLPMLNLLSNTPPPTRHLIRALILTPTRELATQVEASVKNYGRFMKLSSATIYGGADMHKQVQQLRRGVDILIATPGRLLDHIQRRTIDLSHVQILVLDEADRMLDMGFVHDVKKIIATMPRERQTLLFSATMSKNIESLAATVQRQPKIVEIGERRAVTASVTQHFYAVSSEQKLALLFHILDTVEMDSVLVFSRTKHGADKLAHQLERRGIAAVAIHANRTQAQRQRALAGFRKKHYKVLVATDIAARGLDIEGISHVINFDVPTFAEDYVHRIGRTGRASATGDALTLVSDEEFHYFRRICSYVGTRFELRRYPEFEYAARAVHRHPAAPALPKSVSRTSERAQGLTSTAEKKLRRPSSHHSSSQTKPKTAGMSTGSSALHTYSNQDRAKQGHQASVEYSAKSEEKWWRSFLTNNAPYSKRERKKSS